ncbi:MAG: SRPBCC family protein, partial [Deltaproteobacteria bacterium]|nr:SRPBCC family protein [Nannocystaceae bacterium]
LAHELLQATHAQEARRASITWRVLQERRYAHLGPVTAPETAARTDFALERTLAAPVDVVWEILGDFGAAVRWGAPAMETCVVEGVGVGAVRSLSGQGLTVRERLLAHDPATRRLSYSILEPHPLPFADYVTTIEVRPQGPGSCRVRWSATYSPKGAPESASGLLAKVYDANIAGVLRALGLIAA